MLAKLVGYEDVEARNPFSLGDGEFTPNHICSSWGDRGNSCDCPFIWLYRLMEGHKNFNLVMWVQSPLRSLAK